MKWNDEQLELGLSHRRSFHRNKYSHRRMQRATWWFEQMKKAIDGARSWNDPCEVTLTDHPRFTLSDSGARRPLVEQRFEPVTE